MKSGLGMPPTAVPARPVQEAGKGFLSQAGFGEVFQDLGSSEGPVRAGSLSLTWARRQPQGPGRHSGTHTGGQSLGQVSRECMLPGPGRSSRPIKDAELWAEKLRQEPSSAGESGELPSCVHHALGLRP